MLKKAFGQSHDLFTIAQRGVCILHLRHPLPSMLRLEDLTRSVEDLLC